ncbi:gas vesicle protein GvpG [Kitasatospora phosalacinea]|uniref:Gas vesicle protein n=1 Tax=Kitasatospora phosalacinea TaxID=2065 RepID=A0A9W6UMI8_9ACTN|nr:gas vesicle protein GvpG [Kitasatospora phosalacinea]GLW55496.1 gas vesicle protein [Kitasatospora phosalacinea]
MGLITGLLTLPLAPVRGVVWVAEQLYDQAWQELNDPAAVRRQLTEVQAAREAGTISEEEAARREAELVRRLLPPTEGWEV